MPSSAAAPPADGRWRTTVTAIWFSQFLSTLGFGFAVPFAPYYIQELGVTDPVQLRLWVSAFGAATPLTLMVFSPIWGAVADRYGRRLMLLRANFGAVLVLGLMGLVGNVQQLVLLRLLQGVFTGTVTAAQALASAEAPRERSGSVLGAMSAAVFSGTLAGAFVGGFFAHLFGHRLAFLASSLVLLLAGTSVLLFTRETRRPLPPVAAAPGRRLTVGSLLAAQFAALLPCLPILLTLTLTAFTRQFDNALMPLRVQDLLGRAEGADIRAGSITAVCAVAGLLAGFMLGRLADRLPPPRIACVSAAGAGLLMALQGFAPGLLSFTAARFLTVFCAGGLEPVFQIWLAKTTAEERRGAIFGWASTARSAGWVLAPLVSGACAAAAGIRAIYFVGGLLYLLLIPWVTWIAGHVRQAPAPAARA